jgi:hypothetical protein
MTETECMVTEAEWLETADPRNASDWFDNGDARRLGEFLKKRASKRKWDLLLEEENRLLATFPQMPKRTYRDLEAWNRLCLQAMHDIFGPLLFRPIAIDPAWRTSTVLALAAGICEESAFDRLPILADALEEAGCTEPTLLLHCRREVQHIHGCWAVDLLLAKE